jgi:DNA polymerase-3 subunit epsilon
MRPVSGDLSLFGDDEPEQPATTARVEPPIADWQVDLLRKALDARGLTTQGERQAAIAEHAGRPVESLRVLTHEEALRVLSRLGQTPAAKSGTGSAWDERDEDTWIDRL